MSLLSSSGAAAALFPSLGYFGSTDDDALLVPVGDRIRYVCLSVDYGPESILNLRGLAMTRQGQRIELPAGGFQVRQSSTYLGNSSWGAEGLLRETGIHTDAEPRPTWELLLNSPVEVDELRITNRRGEWSCQSTSLTVEVEFANGEHRRVFQAASAERVSRLASHVFELCSIVLRAGIVESVSPGPWTSETIVSTIVAGIRAGIVASADVRSEAAFALLPIWSGRSLNEDEAFLLAHVVRDRAARGLSTSLFEFERCLPDAESISGLARAIAEVSNGREGPSAVVTRGIVVPGPTNEEVAATDDLATRLARWLESRGVPTMSIDDPSDADSARSPWIGLHWLVALEAHDTDSGVLALRALVTDLRGAGFTVRGFLPARLDIDVEVPGSRRVVRVSPALRSFGRTQVQASNGRFVAVEDDGLFDVSKTDEQRSPTNRFARAPSRWRQVMLGLGHAVDSPESPESPHPSGA